MRKTGPTGSLPALPPPIQDKSPNLYKQNILRILVQGLTFTNDRLIKLAYGKKGNSYKKMELLLRTMQPNTLKKLNNVLSKELTSTNCKRQIEALKQHEITDADSLNQFLEVIKKQKKIEQNKVARKQGISRDSTC